MVIDVGLVFEIKHAVPRHSSEIFIPKSQQSKAILYSCFKKYLIGSLRTGAEVDLGFVFKNTENYLTIYSYTSKKPYTFFWFVCVHICECEVGVPFLISAS